MGERGTVRGTSVAQVAVLGAGVLAGGLGLLLQPDSAVWAQMLVTGLGAMGVNLASAGIQGLADKEQRLHASTINHDLARGVLEAVRQHLTGIKEERAQGACAHITAKLKDQDAIEKAFRTLSSDADIIATLTGNDSEAGDAVWGCVLSFMETSKAWTKIQPLLTSQKDEILQDLARYYAGQVADNPRLLAKFQYWSALAGHQELATLARGLLGHDQAVKRCFELARQGRQPTDEEVQRLLAYLETYWEAEPWWAKWVGTEVAVAQAEWLAQRNKCWGREQDLQQLHRLLSQADTRVVAVEGYGATSFLAWAADVLNDAGTAEQGHGRLVISHFFRRRHDWLESSSQMRRNLIRQLGSHWLTKSRVATALSPSSEGLGHIPDDALPDTLSALLRQEWPHPLVVVLDGLDEAKGLSQLVATEQLPPHLRFVVSAATETVAGHLKDLFAGRTLTTPGTKRLVLGPLHPNSGHGWRAVPPAAVWRKAGNHPFFLGALADQPPDVLNALPDNLPGWLMQHCITVRDAGYPAPADALGVLAAVRDRVIDLGQGTVPDTLRAISAQVPDQEQRAGLPSVASNLPRLSPHLVFRPEVDGAIHSALMGAARGAQPAVAVRGHGKTTAALLYAAEHEADYPGGRYVVTLTSRSLAAQLAALRRHFAVPGELDERAAAAAVAERLGQGDTALLILDSVPDGQAWRQLRESGCLPGPQCHLLVTTEAERLAAATPVKVPPMTGEETRAVLGRYGQEAPAAVAAEIAEWLGGLPTAIAAVGAGRRKGSSPTWQEYVEALRGTPARELPDQQPDVRREISVAGTDFDVAPTARVIDQTLKSLEPLERQVLVYAALLPPKMIPRPWLIALSQASSAAAAGAAKVAEAVDSLIDLDLLQPVSSAGAVSAGVEGPQLLALPGIWRQRVREVAAKDLQNATDRVVEYACGRARFLAEEHRGEELRHRWELSPLAQLARDLLNESALAVGDGLAELADKVDDQLFGLGLSRTEERGALLEAWLRASPNQTEDERSDRALVLRSLAMVREDQGRRDEAETLFDEVLRTQRSLLGRDDPQLGVTLNNFAAWRRTRGDLAEAYEMWQEALRIALAQPTPDPESVASKHHNLAVVARDRGELTAAEDHLREALKELAAAGPAAGDARPTSLQKKQALYEVHLGAVLLDRGQVEEALDWLLAATQRIDQLYGADPDHEHVGHAHVYLAAAFLAACDTGNAEHHLQRPRGRLPQPTWDYWCGRLRHAQGDDGGLAQIRGAFAQQCQNHGLKNPDYLRWRAWYDAALKDRA